MCFKSFMKRIEEVIPLILKDLESVAKIKDKKVVFDADFKKYLRNMRIALEDSSKNINTLRTSFRGTLGYFPEGVAEKIKEIQDKILDLISELREKESKYFPSPKESFEEVKNKLSKEAEELIEKMKSL